MGLFGDLQVRVDPWEVEYGAELPLEGTPEEAPEGVVLGSRINSRIISELTMRLPERIVVEKRSDGSRIHLEAD
jgi:hypothetical protein